jgi:hypothetical protein
VFVSARREGLTFAGVTAQPKSLFRDKFTDSLRLAAVGYHFRKLSDAYGDG